ncbi:MAG: hypothetical protein KGJ05_02060, partial [Alphaproteobacteria bacterium]|nr:hypothetical protein [Alphaproteobacteria bacterium]
MPEAEAQAARNLIAARIARILIVGLAAALILYGLPAMPLTGDESWSKWMSGMGWGALFAAVRAYEFHPPFYYSLLKMWRGAAGSSVMALRFPSIIAGLGLILLGWRMARVIGAFPWLAALLLALNRTLIVHDRLARPYALMALAVTGCLALVLRIGQGGARWFHYLAYALVLESVLWLHALGVLYAGALALALFVVSLKRDWLRLIGLHIAVGLVWLPCLQLLLFQQTHRSHGWLVFHWAEVAPNLGEAFAGIRLWPGLILAVGLAAWGSMSLWRGGKGRIAAALFIVALLPIAGEVALSAAITPVFLMRYIVPSILPLTLLMAVPGFPLSLKRVQWVAWGLMLAWLGYGVWVELSTPPEEQWNKVVVYLNTHVARDEELWVIPNDNAMYLRDNAGAAGLKFALVAQPAAFPAPDYKGGRDSGSPAVPGLDAASINRMIAEARARGRRTL